MFFPATVNSAEKTIKRRSPNGALCDESLPGGPHLLWLCKQIRDLASDGISDSSLIEELAQTRVMDLTTKLLQKKWWNEALAQRLLALDKKHGFDKAHPRQCLAIDLRNVIYLDERRFAPSVFSIIRQLVVERFDRNVYIMIRSKPTNPLAHQEFLDRHKFFKKTGVWSVHIVCYQSRPQTLEYCQRFGVTHYISNRIGVLNYAESAHSLFAFNAEPAMTKDGISITPVMSWNRIGRLLLGEGMTL